MATTQKRGNRHRGIARVAGIGSDSKSFDTKTEALTWAVLREQEMKSGKFSRHGDKTFGDLLETYAEKVSPTHKGKRWEEIRINLICKYPIAKIKLSELGARHFTEWRDTRMGEVSAGSVRREWTLINSAMNVAINEWEWLHENPLKKIKRPPPPKSRDRLITDDEIEKLLHSAGYTKEGALDTKLKRVAAIFLFAIETGMRLKEMTRLTWHKAHAARRFVRVTDDSKTGARDVPLSTEAVRILEQCLMNKESELVFDLTESQVDSLYRKLKAMAGVEGFTFHDTKHLACTRLSEYLSPFELARAVGTRDTRVLMIYYNKSAENIAKSLP